MATCVVRTSLLACQAACVSLSIIPFYQRHPLALPPPVEYAVMTAISPSWTSNFSGVLSLQEVNESLTRPIDAPYSCVCVFFCQVLVCTYRP